MTWTPPPQLLLPDREPNVDSVQYEIARLDGLAHRSRDPVSQDPLHPRFCAACGRDLEWRRSIGARCADCSAAA